MKAIRILFNAKIMVFSLLVLMSFMLVACNTSDDNDNEDDILVTSIAVTTVDDVSTITEPEGTLQLSVTILPTDATNKEVTWSVINGTGLATISTNGLLTALVDGTVTVKASSNSTPAISGTKVITISDQAEVDMNTTVTAINVDGVSVLEFNPLIPTYTYVISNGTTQTPVVTMNQYETGATVVIDPAADVTSSNVEDRTTTITVTSSSGDEKVYTVVFQSNIEPVDLGSANNFVILAESGISTATSSVITGDIGLSPAAATYLTGFSLTMHASGEYSTSAQVTGNLYASDYTSPTPSVLTTAISDMQTAYVDAAGRAANYTELYSGDLSGKTLTPGVFKFGSSVLINTDLTLKGNADDVWIFQISGGLTMASNINIILEGGADAKNIIWQVADTVSIGSDSHFEGTILAMTNISMGTNSSINGRLYAQTAVTLDATTVNKSNE